jgi:hypothetical protein
MYIKGMVAEGSNLLFIEFVLGHSKKINSSMNIRMFGLRRNFFAEFQIKKKEKNFISHWNSQVI